VSQPTGITINNTHLLRAAMLLMVLGIIGPGLFQLKPPRWFAESEGAGHLEMAAVDDVPPVSVPVTSPPAFAPDAKPDAQVGTQSSISSGISSGTKSAIAPASDAANDRGKAPDTRLSDTTPVTAETAGQRISPPPRVEQPAVAARKTRPMPSSDEVASTGASTGASTDTPATRKTNLVSRVSGTAKVPTFPNPSSVPLDVMRKFTKSIPDSHTALPVKRQKESFIAITLPLILAANEEIAQRRNAIKRAVARGDQPTLERWARLYRIDTEDTSPSEVERQLLLRADFVPVSLALAQAAIESGWGTSRFALQGNALFGQWAWQKDAGLKPARASNSEAVVRSFPNLFGSVRAYMHNLNTHPRYAAFRARRHLLRGRTQADLGYQLSNFLDGYAEIGEAYVAKLKALIRSNNFGQYESARLH
jgi:Bax protein